jgi:hypothetical protein
MRIVRNRRKASLAFSAVAAVLLLLAMSYSIAAQEEEFECQWEKEVWINGAYAGQWDEGPFRVVLSDTVTMSEALSCNFDYAWVVQEDWLVTGMNNMKFVGADYISGTVEELMGGVKWYDGAWNQVAVPAGTWVTITKDLEVAHPGPAQLQIDESFISYPSENVEMMQRTVELENLVEGGDAPASDSHAPYTMTTYPGSGVQANFPVVWDWNGTLGLSPYGFCHYASGTSFLGTAPTYELDADVLPDDDSVTNIDPATDTPDRDGSDDGVTFPLILPHNGTAIVHVEGENHSGGSLYLNAWADWTRDGDWEDPVYGEWIIQDEPVPVPSGPPYTFTLDIPITPFHPGASTEPLWVRATLSEVELEPLDSYYYAGAQPHPAWQHPFYGDSGCFQDGETEDYFIEPLPTDCLWEKQVYINGEYAGEWDDGPFVVTLYDDVTIDQAVSCNFDYTPSLLESWDSSVLYLSQHHELSGTVTTDWSSYLNWHFGATRIPANTWVTMTNRLRVTDSGWESTTINESAGFDPVGLMLEPRPVVLEEPACDWEKMVYINDEYAGEWDEGPFTTMIDDKVAINDELACNFDYEWSLLEEWAPDLLSLVAEDHISGTTELDPPTSPDSLHWYGGDPVPVPAGTSVIISKTLSVDHGFAGQSVISQTVEFGPYGSLTQQRPVILESHGCWIPGVLKRY